MVKKIVSKRRRVKHRKEARRKKIQKRGRRKYRKSRIADEWARYPVDPPLSAGQSQSRHSDAEEHVEEVFVFVFDLNLYLYC